MNIQFVQRRQQRPHRRSLCHLRECIDILREALAAISQLAIRTRDRCMGVVDVGGCKNTLLNELTAKYTQKRVLTGPTESTALGNLLLQMIGANDLSDIAEGRRLVEKSFDIK